MINKFMDFTTLNDQMEIERKIKKKKRIICIFAI